MRCAAATSRASETNAEEMDRYARGGKRLHTAIRYGVSQALLHATALAHRQTMAEVIAREYGSTIATAPIPILASCHKDDPGQLDRVILKRVELLPHASFQIVSEHVGLQGEKLAAFVRRVAHAHARRSATRTTTRASTSISTGRSASSSR